MIYDFHISIRVTDVGVPIQNIRLLDLLWMKWKIFETLWFNIIPNQTENLKRKQFVYDFRQDLNVRLLLVYIVSVSRFCGVTSETAMWINFIAEIFHGSSQIKSQYSMFLALPFSSRSFSLILVCLALVYLFCSSASTKMSHTWGLEKL